MAPPWRRRPAGAGGPGDGPGGLPGGPLAPEPYKGKGIMYRGERIRRKAGKTGKTGAGAAK